MKKKIGMMTILFLLFNLIILQKSNAKYTIQDTLQITYYLDKISPVIDVATAQETESFDKTQPEIIQKTDSVIIHTSDNVEIEKNEYYYNPSEPSFDGAQEFESGQEFGQEGYYKIVATDTSGNVTEIIMLLDKSAPEVFVKYFKKGEMSANLSLNHVRKIAATKKCWMMENIANTIQETDESILNEEINENIEKTEIQEELKDQEKIEEQEELENQEKAEVEKSEEIIAEEMESIEETATEDESVMVEEEIEVTSNEAVEMNTATENEIMPLLADIYVGNEAEFRNALIAQASVIHLRQSIDFHAPIYINYDVTIVNESAENALRYKGNGSFMVIQNGGSLTVNGIVIDTNSSGIGGVTALDIQSGGCVTFIHSAIVDGGLDNTGILINGGGSLVLWSCEIVRCGIGVNLQADGKLLFATQQDRSNNFYWNKIAVYIDNFYGICDFNQNIGMHDNTDYAIFVANSSGTINVSAGSYYANKWAIAVGGSLNLTGGYIYSNTYGILLNSFYSGKFQMTGGSIYYNTSYAIYHSKENDGDCTITGGQVHGEIYLDKKDNYVNTNSSYPTFTVTPSCYYFKRKLVRTSSHENANIEITKFILTLQDAWYKYVDNEYVVLWSGSNVVARYKDYDGNILKQEILNGAIGATYSITPPIIPGYDLVEIPSNAQGIYGQHDIFVDFKYDLVNVAKATFEDLLSGVISAKYWYNANSQTFNGDGTDFANGTTFENYGYYKIKVVNGVGLEKQMVFELNKNSVVR